MAAIERVTVMCIFKWTYSQIIQEVQLEQFFTKLRDDLQVTRLSHFDYVKTDDLEKIGMSRPSARRLVDACKKRKSTLRKKSIFHRFLGRYSDVLCLNKFIYTYTVVIDIS